MVRREVVAAAYSVSNSGVQQRGENRATLFIFVGRIDELTDRSLLNQEEQLRLATFQSIKRQGEFCAGRNLVQQALRQLSSIEDLDLHQQDQLFPLVFNGQKQLVLEGHPQLRLSLSHAAEWVGVAVQVLADGQQPGRSTARSAASGFYPAISLGFDLEYVDPTRGLEDLEKITRFSFTQKEWVEWNALPLSLKSAAFYRLWSLKEAYKKATGFPFFRVARTIEFRALTKPSWAMSCSTLEMISEYVAALVTPADSLPSISAHAWCLQSQQFVRLPINRIADWQAVDMVS